MIRRFQYQNPNGETVDLADVEAGYVPQRIAGAEIPLPDNQSVSTPNRDGQTYIRTLLEPRFINLDVHLLARGEDLRVKKREMFRALNPKPGLGRIVYRPDGDEYDEPEYEIDAIYETSAGWGVDRLGETITVSFRCPDPAWRLLPENVEMFQSAGSGMSVPTDVDTDFLPGAPFPVVNTGDLESFPVFVIHGGVTRPLMRNSTSDKTFELDVSIGDDQTAVIDMNRRTAVRSDGLNLMPFRTPESEMWALEPGENVIELGWFTAPSPPVQFDMTYSTRLVGV